MTTRTGLRGLQRAGELATDLPPFPGTPEWEKDARFTGPTPSPRYAPPSSKRRLFERPAVGMAHRRDVASAMSESRAGWISRHGAVIVKGEGANQEALKAHPETAAVMEAFTKAETRWGVSRTKSLAAELDEHVSKGGTRETFFFGHTSYEEEHPRPVLAEFLFRAGWIEVTLDTNDGDTALRSRSPVDIDAYRTPLVALANSLRCLVLGRTAGGGEELLYDPTDADAPARFSRDAPGGIEVDHGGPIPAR